WLQCRAALARHSAELTPTHRSRPVFNAFKRLTISAKLSSALVAALAALCIVGAIGLLAVRQIERLGHDRQVEGVRLSDTETAVLVGVERAIGLVYSAPSELDLGQLKAKQERFQTLLREASQALQTTAAST